MIDEIYNSRIDAIKTYHSTDEWEKTATKPYHILKREPPI